MVNPYHTEPEVAAVEVEVEEGGENEGPCGGGHRRDGPAREGARAHPGSPRSATGEPADQPEGWTRFFEVIEDDERPASVSAAPSPADPSDCAADDLQCSARTFSAAARRAPSKAKQVPGAPLAVLAADAQEAPRPVGRVVGAELDEAAIGEHGHRHDEAADALDGIGVPHPGTAVKSGAWCLDCGEWDPPARKRPRRGRANTKR